MLGPFIQKTMAMNVIAIFLTLLLTSVSALLNPEQKQATEHKMPPNDPRCPAASSRCRFVGPGELPSQRKFYVDDKLLSMKFVRNELYMDCSNKVSLESMAMPRFNHMLVINVSLADCYVPQGSYRDALAAMNITVLHKLLLEWTWVTPPESAEMVIGGHHLTGLRNVRTLYVASGERWPLLLADALHPLEQLRELYTLNIRFSLPLPPGNRIERIKIMGGEPIGVLYLKDCSQLRMLSIFSWNVASLPSHWLTGCSKLESISIHNLPVTKLPERMLHEAMSLRSLTIADCTRLTELFPQFFVNTSQLQDLDLSKNGLINLPSGIFKHLIMLKDLNLSGNEFGAEVAVELEPLEELQCLSLAENPIGDFCTNYRSLYNHTVKSTIEAISEIENELKELSGTFSSTGYVEEMFRAQLVIQQLPKLKQLDLQRTEAQQLCAGYWSTMPALQVIDYSNNQITEVTYRELEVVQKLDWQVNVCGNPIRAVRLEQYNYEALLEDNTLNSMDVKRGSIKIDSTLDCDCRSYWFARAYQARPAMFPVKNLQCKQGELLELVSPDTMLCKRKDSDCAAGCTCYQRVRDDATLANCTTGILERLPNLTRLAELRAPGNRISTLDVDDLPDTLVYLDIRNNLISRLEYDAVKALFEAGPRRELLLSGNQFECDCRAFQLLTGIKKYREQVLDYHNVTCSNGRLLRSVRPVWQCILEWSPSAAGMIAILALLSLIIAALYYQRELKVYMYARGWCQCWVNEEDIDTDKQYDVFVAFAHADEQFVVDVLIPRLEREPHALNVCVHYRDWIVGDLIPAQITRSVEDSRRTIAVVSRNFLGSMWARAEFRVAHALALREGRVRLVIVMLEDVSDDERLEDELRAYLLTNTYVKWGDPRFWEKLLYALPHHSIRRRQRAEPMERGVRSEGAQLVLKSERPARTEQVALVDLQGER